MLQEAQTLIHWVVLHQDALLQLVGGAAGLSAAAQITLHKLKVKWSVDSKAFSFTLVQVLTLASAVVAYLAANADFAVVYPWLATTVATVHRFFISPYYNKKILPYLEFQASKESMVNQPLPTPVAPQEPVPAQVPSFVS